MHTSNVGSPPAVKDYTNIRRKHKLVIHEECVLSVYRDTKQVWTIFGTEDSLEKPVLAITCKREKWLHVNQCYNDDGNHDCIWYPHTLLLQHDCNLVQFVGQDTADDCYAHSTIFCGLKVLYARIWRIVICIASLVQKVLPGPATRIGKWTQ